MSDAVSSEVGQSATDHADDTSGTPDAFFHNAQHFVVSGGNFTRNVTHVYPPVPSDFRRIPLGDIDLRNKIRADDSGVTMVYRRHAYGTLSRCARRIYLAHIEGRQSDMTVVIYEGPNAEETWKFELEKYAGLRHPNLLQLHGTTSSSGLYATIFLDELVPLKKYMKGYRHCLFSTVYLYRCFDQEAREAKDYLASFLGWDLDQAWLMMANASTPWVRRSTGQLCVEPETRNEDTKTPVRGISGDSFNIPLSALGEDPVNFMISALSISEFHQICAVYLPTFDSEPTRGTHFPVRLGGIHSITEDGIEIAHLPASRIRELGWEYIGTNTDQELTVMDNGWTRFASSSPLNAEFYRTNLATVPQHFEAWLSQANYIFNEASIATAHEDYFCLLQVDYRVRPLGTPKPSEIPPESYLFLCPIDDFKSEDGKFIEHPTCPAYWSLDPLGRERLCPEDASQLGFPALRCERIIWRRSWGDHVYAGISQFHGAKGFDPNSQDIARYLGYPLFELSFNPIQEQASIEELPEEDVVEPDEGNNRSSVGVAGAAPGDLHGNDDLLQQLAALTGSSKNERPAVLHNFLLVAGGIGIILAVIVTVHLS